jgi:hypothetical protein
MQSFTNIGILLQSDDGPRFFGSLGQMSDEPRFPRRRSLRHPLLAADL